MLYDVTVSLMAMVKGVLMDEVLSQADQWFESFVRTVPVDLTMFEAPV